MTLLLGRHAWQGDRPILGLVDNTEMNTV